MNALTSLANKNTVKTNNLIIDKSNNNNINNNNNNNSNNTNNTNNANNNKKDKHKVLKNYLYGSDKK